MQRKASELPVAIDNRTMFALSFEEDGGESQALASCDGRSLLCTGLVGDYADHEVDDCA